MLSVFLIFIDTHTQDIKGSLPLNLSTYLIRTENDTISIVFHVLAGWNERSNEKPYFLWAVRSTHFCIFLLGDSVSVRIIWRVYILFVFWNTFVKIRLRFSQTDEMLDFSCENLPERHTRKMHTNFKYNDYYLHKRYYLSC